MNLAGRRVALYARFSSDRQNEASVDDQLDRCRRWVAERGGTVAHAFADRAVSAASMDRPGWRELERATGAGLVDVIVAESMDRVSRKTGDTMQLVERLRFAGVVLHTLSDGIDTSSKGAKMATAFRGLVGDLYLDDLADKTRRGMEARARDGKATGALPYGFRSVPGERGAAIEVDHAQADVVRRVFAAYANGASRNEIAASLNRDGVPAPRASHRDRETLPAWMHTTIRAMLGNEAYAGRWVWNRRAWIKEPGSNRRVCRLRPRSEWVTLDRPELAIVDAATWAACNARSEATARSASTLTTAERRGNNRRAYLLSGLLRCGVCRALMAIHGGTAAGGKYYRCSAASDRGTCANRLSVREDAARSSFVGLVRARLFAPEVLADVHETARAFLVEAAESAQSDLPDRRARLARVEAKIARVVDAIADGASAALGAKLRGLEEEARAERLAIAAAEAACGLHELPSAEELVAIASSIDVAIDGADVPAAREALRGLLVDGAILATPRGDRYVLDAGLMPAALVGAARSVGTIAGARWAHQRARVSVPAARRSA
jgi:DNA invertase Pin-like site-specific DNA recombinase